MNEITRSTGGTFVLVFYPWVFMLVIGPVALGLALAHRAGSLSLMPTLISLFWVLLLVIVAGVHKEPSAGDIIQQDGKSLSSTTRRGYPISYGSLLLLLVGIVLSFVYMVFLGRWPMVIIGVISLGVALIHKDGIFPTALYGYTEDLIFMLLGMATVGGTYYLQSRELSYLLLLISIPPVLLFTALNMVKNLKEYDRDRKSGKKTVGVSLGRYKMIQGYKIVLIASYFVPLALAFFKRADALILLPLCTLPMTRSLLMKVECDLDTNLDELFTSTAALTLMFCLMLSAGLVYHL